MTQQEKIKYFTMGLAIVGIRVDEKTAEMISMVYDSIKKKKGNFSIKDAVAIEYAVRGEIAEKQVVAKSEEEERDNPLINAARGRDASGINEDELK